MCNLHQPTTTQAPKQRFGYLDIKQSSKVRTRKLKSWRKRWVVLTQLSNMSNNERVAKLDLYDCEAKWRKNSSDKDTFILENVTSIKKTPSRTHQHAFELSESDRPELVLSGTSELDSYSWIYALKQIFTPDEIEKAKESFKVSVIANEYSGQWNLCGDFRMTVSPTCVSLVGSDGVCVISWALSTIIRFRVDKCQTTGEMSVLVIESGPNAPTGQSCFSFQSHEAQDILCAIKQSICQAQIQLQQPKSESCRSHQFERSVSQKSNHSVTVTPTLEHHSSDRRIHNNTLNHTLEHQTSTHDVMSNFDILSAIAKQNSAYVNSCSSTNNAPTNMSKSFSSSPLSSIKRSHINSELGLLIEAEENQQQDLNQLDEIDIWDQTIMTNNEIGDLMHKKSSLHASKTVKSYTGYGDIKEETKKEKQQKSRRHSYACEISKPSFERTRSVSAVVAIIKANSDRRPGRTVSFENDNKSDIDSAISSMAFSSENDDIPWPDLPCMCNSLDSPKKYDPIDRNKCNSTPDLNTYWKKFGGKSGFENDYEDLDELKCSMQRFRQKQLPSIPPALPARPASLSFSSSTDHNSKTSPKKRRRSFFRRSEKCSSADEIHNINNTKQCETTKSQKSCSHSGLVPSCVCEDNKFPRKSKSFKKKSPTKEDPHGNSCWYIDDINNRIIPELQLVKRRSSDITFSDSFDSKTADSVHSKTNSLPSIMRSSFSISKSSAENELNKREDQTNPTPRTTSPKPILTSKKNSGSSNPLLSFFLDDLNFESHPMVTGKLPNQLNALVSNTFSIESDNIYKIPLSVSLQTVHQSRFCHEPNTEVNKGFHSTSPASHPNYFHMWSLENSRQRANNVNPSDDEAILPIYSSPTSIYQILRTSTKKHPSENVDIFSDISNPSLIDPLTSEHNMAESYENVKDISPSSQFLVDQSRMNRNDEHFYENGSYSYSCMAVPDKCEQSNQSLYYNVGKLDNCDLMSRDSEERTATVKQPVREISVTPGVEPLLLF